MVEKDERGDDAAARKERAAQIHRQIEQLKKGKESSDDEPVKDAEQQKPRKESPREFVDRKSREFRDDDRFGNDG